MAQKVLPWSISVFNILFLVAFFFFFLIFVVCLFLEHYKWILFQKNLENFQKLNIPWKRVFIRMEISIQNYGTECIRYLQMVYWIQIQIRSTLSAIGPFPTYLFMILVPIAAQYRIIPTSSSSSCFNAKFYLLLTK